MGTGAAMSGARVHPSTGAGLAVHFSSATAEHYTPAHVIAVVVACLGGIDLDPCSNSHEDPAVPAAGVFTIADDGLRQAWHGRVYMNPPYGGAITAWVEKLADEYEAGRVTEAIALVPARTDTRWWRRMGAHPVCFVWGRLRFSGASAGAPFPSALVYLGPRPAAFAAACGALGRVYVPAGLDV
jgi:hypothetical protein